MGVFGSMIAGVLLQKFKRYKLMLIFCSAMTTLGMWIGCLTIPTEDKWLITANFWFAGLFIVPIIPISMNFADELCFPLEATAIQGILLSFA
jgi:MFS family permease